MIDDIMRYGQPKCMVSVFPRRWRQNKGIGAIAIGVILCEWAFSLVWAVCALLPVCAVCTVCAVCALCACGARRLGATEADLARARSQSSQGADVFTHECARCHGERGEGLAGASPVLGPGALPEYPRDNGPGAAMPTDQQQLQIQVQTRPAGAPWRDPFRTALDLHDFVRTHMPKSRATEIKPEDYWAVVSFMIAVQGGQLPADGLNERNAASAPVPH